MPTPATPTVRPARLDVPQVASAAARMPWNTPYAVSTERVARTAVRHGATGHEAALLGDDVHVLGVGADVAGGVVAPGQRLDEAPVGAEQRRRLLGVRVADDHCLAAAEVEPGHRRLVGHPAGEVQRVAQRLGVAGVGVEAGAAERRTAGGGVDRDDGLAARCGRPDRRRPARGREVRRTPQSPVGSRW